MSTQTLLLIILSALIALGLVVFQYRYRSRLQGKLAVLLSFLRFVTWFVAFLLLVNPKFSRNTYSIEKSDLVVLVDNSSSIDGDEVRPLLQKIKQRTELSDKFNLRFHAFGGQFNNNDSLTFDERKTNIAAALKATNSIYAGKKNAVVLISDGNQTLGEEYEFFARNADSPLFPIVVGDTTRFEDLRIGQVNSNRYAFLKNKFPLEIYIDYEGENTVNFGVTVTMNGKNVYRENKRLSPSEPTTVISTLLNATSVGVKNVSVSVSPLKNERNTSNNSRKLAIEVIDEKTNVFVISELSHPDIGTLIKSIESNEQRAVTVKKPSTAVTDLEEADLFVLYQPTRAFKNVLEYIKQKKANTFTITGPKTDWTFLNANQSTVTKNSYEQAEEVLPLMNSGFSLFGVSDFATTDFPPLTSNLGEVIISKPHEVLLSQEVKGVSLNEPLWAVSGDESVREAFLFGENLWKWRMQSYRSNGDFLNFDGFMGKLIRYLSSGKLKSRFSVDYERVYEGSDGAKLTAIYFDKAFIFDANATIDLQLRNSENGATRSLQMLSKGAYYEADLSDLPSGNYTFTATVAQERLSKSGSFTILDFDVEQQLVSSDYQKLGRLATNSNGKRYFPADMEALLNDFNADQRFIPTQKSVQNVVSLIDFRMLLAILAASLAIEWFLRKYNGLT
ncbi:VWA domain-containing protein [Maribacter sp. 2-571]|uniref:VWA domain-containing protein n=1 Tax=Maribacter sp. 2-571 TaxID=3417569 RepID=UPI003D3580EC